MYDSSPVFCMLICIKDKLWWEIIYFLFFWIVADSYGLDNDDFDTEELEEAVADIQDTLGADNYEDQLSQPEVIVYFHAYSISTCLFSSFCTPNEKNPCVKLVKCGPHPSSLPCFTHSTLKFQCALHNYFVGFQFSYSVCFFSPKIIATFNFVYFPIGL